MIQTMCVVTLMVLLGKPLRIPNSFLKSLYSTEQHNMAEAHTLNNCAHAYRNTADHYNNYVFRCR